VGEKVIFTTSSCPRWVRQGTVPSVVDWRVFLETEASDQNVVGENQLNWIVRLERGCRGSRCSKDGLYSRCGIKVTKVLFIRLCKHIATYNCLQLCQRYLRLRVPQNTEQERVFID